MKSEFHHPNKQLKQYYESGSHSWNCTNDPEIISLKDNAEITKTGYFITCSTTELCGTLYKRDVREGEFYRII